MATTSYIIWDFDGTLGHRTGMWSGTLLEVLRSHNPGTSLTIEHFHPFLVSGFRWHRTDIKHRPCSADEWWLELEPLFERAFREAAGLPQTQAAQLAKEVRSTYLAPTQWQLFSDVRETLAMLTIAGWRHVLLSNHIPELKSIMQSLDLLDHFTSIFNSADTGFEKPHREAFENVRRSLPSRSNIWMVGDNFAADIQGAEGVGIPAILVRKSHPAAKRYAQHLTDVIAFLEGPK